MRTVRPTSGRPRGRATRAHDREILRLAVPAFGALVAEPLFLLADSAIVGHLGTPQLAGLGVAGACSTTAVSVCVFLAYGTTAVGGPPGGRRRPARRPSRQGVDGIWLGVGLGVVWPSSLAAHGRPARRRVRHVRPPRRRTP